MSYHAVSTLIRRSVVASRTNAIRGGMTPPLPPFQRLPVPTQKLSEQNDCLWDDAVAPELAFDFDAPHISTAEALATLMAVFGSLYGLLMLVKFSDPESKNPAVCRTVDMVCDWSGAPLKKSKD